MMESQIEEKPPQRVVKIKDPKRQELGRLGAAARKAKEHARLLQELATVKEKEQSEHEPQVVTVSTTPQKQSRPVEDGRNMDWFVTVGLALLAGVIVFFRQKPKAVAQASPTRQAPPSALEATPNIFTME